MKSNPLVRLSACSNTYIMFYGYVKGAQSINERATIYKLAETFLKEYELEDTISEIDLRNAYVRITKIMIKIKKC